MSYIADHQERAFGRLMSQYRFDVTGGVNPLTLNPTGAFATHRLDACKSDYIMRMQRDSDDVLINVYDFKQDDGKYKSSKEGSWISIDEGETYLLDTWYNQNVVGNDASQSTKAKKPTVIFNNRNGWPAIDFDGSDDELVSSADMIEFIKTTVGLMFAGYYPKGTPPTITDDSTYLLQPVITDTDAFAIMSRGISTYYGPNDSVFVDVYYTTQVAVPIEVVADTKWCDFVWRLSGNVLYGYKDGVFIDDVSAGEVGDDLDSLMRMGKHPYTTNYLEGRLDQIYTFNEDLTVQQIADVSLYMRTR